jgi:transposase
MLISKKIRLEVSEQDAATLEADLLCVECGLVMDRDENSAVNILTRFLARLGPHTDEPVHCADVFTAIEDVSTL